MSELTDLLLALVLNFGALALGSALLIGALGVPMPTTLLVIAGGAYVRQGMIDPLLLVGFGLIGAVIGDTITYGIGRYAGGWSERRYGNAGRWMSARASFQKYGGLSIFLTRFLIPALAFPVSLLAGSTAYGYRRFLPRAIAGEILWIVLFGGLGYAFNSQWVAISQFVSNFSGLLAGLALLGAAIYIVVYWLRRR